MTQFPERTELGLRPRLIAAGWFGLAACIPIIFFFAVFAHNGNGSLRDNLNGLWFFAVLPISIAALLGFTIGSRILDLKRPRSAARAMMSGTLIAVLSYFGLVFAHTVLAVVLSRGQFFEGQSIESLLVGILLVYGVGAILVGWIVVIAGAVAGLLLYKASRTKTLRVKLIKVRPVRRRTVSAWIAAATFMLIVANALILLLPSLLLASERLFFRILDRFDPIAVSMQWADRVVLR